jgi:hypothetical protein
MSDIKAIADRFEIEALRGEFTDAAMMRDYDWGRHSYQPCIWFPWGWWWWKTHAPIYGSLTLILGNPKALRA